MEDFLPLGSPLAEGDKGVAGSRAIPTGGKPAGQQHPCGDEPGRGKQSRNRFHHAGEREQ